MDGRDKKLKDQALWHSHRGLGDKKERKQVEGKLVKYGVMEAK